MTTCIIAEKPSVARDIARIVGATNKEDGYLEGNNYIVTWAIGHLITLAMPEEYGFSEYNKEDLPIIPNPFILTVRQIRKEKTYLPDKAALKQLNAIKNCFENADKIIAATDAGREGELIFRWIYKYLDCNKPFDRLWISSLTDKAIREGLSNTKNGTTYDNLFSAAQARSEADWLIGINASRALSIARKGGYSLGRVQTPTLAMVCRRFIENKNFSSVPYWKLNISTNKDDVLIKVASTSTFDSEESANTALHSLKNKDFLSVKSVNKKRGNTQPPLLYDLTTLQKEANREHGFSADKTLSLAQSLYEKKITTYPRTGSRYISEDVFEEIPSLIKTIGEISIEIPNRHSVDDKKVTDHHAIIPTGEKPIGLTNDEMEIYKMIVNRFLEALSPNSEEERIQVELTDGTYSFIWKARRPISLGWKAIQKGTSEEQEKKTDKEEIELTTIPDISQGDKLELKTAEISQHKTKPKPLYSEASLLSAMENAGKDIEKAENRKALADCGIGTPATRANIIETLILREYIRREKKAIIPTDKGLSVYEIIKNKKIADAEMTGAWEVALTAIEEGKMEKDTFSKSIGIYAQQICAELLSLHCDTKNYPTYRCPKCGNQSFGIYAKVAKCKKEDCNFIIFREICGTFLSEDNIRDLINNNKTPILKGLKNKAGKKFNARLALNEECTTFFEFENKKKK